MNKFFRENRNIILAFLLSFLAVYGLTLTIRDTGSAIGCLCIYIPATLIFIGMWLGMKNGFSWVYALGVILIFIPAIWTRFNTSAWVYAPIYGVLALVGNLLGSDIRIIRSRKKKL